MKRLAFMLLLLTGAAMLRAQQNGIEQNLDIVTMPAGEKVIVWYGHVGRSYFVQVSDPSDHLNKWTWAPIIEGGNDRDISHEVGGTADKGFFRLKYTDQVPGPGENLDTADFDGDGISNFDEVNICFTDPLNPDCDGDGYTDGEEITASTDPLDQGSFPLKVIGSIPRYLPGYDSSSGYPAGQPIILYFNKELPAVITTITAPWLIDMNATDPAPVPGNTIILPGRKAVAFVPTGNSLFPWPEEDALPPIYQIVFNQETTGISHLIPFNRSFTTTTGAGSVDSGPWVGPFSPGSNYIDASVNTIITVKWSEPLDPTTVVAQNISLVSVDETSVECSVDFDYGKDANILRITPTQALASATKYTVTLGNGFKNLTEKAHAQTVSWSFTTRSERPAPIPAAGPYVIAISPADFSFGIDPPNCISITFSEDMDPSTLTTEQFHLRGGNSSDLPGTINYSTASRTLVFQPDAAFTTSTYYAITLDLESIFNLPATGSPSHMQGNDTFVFSTANSTTGGGSGDGSGSGGDGTPSPARIESLQIHYTWGAILGSTQHSGCAVEIRLIDKAGQMISKTLPSSVEAVQVLDSGEISPATTVVITPNFVPGTAKNVADESKEMGIFIIPSYAKPPPGMTYLVFRTTGAGGSFNRSGSGGPFVVIPPGNVEYLGTFGISSHYQALCADLTGNGPQSLYLVPVPIIRDIPGDSYGYSLIENEFAKALPGHKMKLRFEDTYLTLHGPGGVTLNSFQWNLPGKNFKNYLPDPAKSNYSDLLASDLSDVQEVNFYWTDAGNKEAKIDFHIEINGSQVGAENSKSTIHVDSPASTFKLEIGEERVDEANDRQGNLVKQFGLFTSETPNVYPGAKFIGSVTTPTGWPTGEWSFVQVIKSQRKYTYAGGARSHLGDGNSFKLDMLYPYIGPFSANGSVPPDDCSDTPRDSLTGQPNPNASVTNRTELDIAESFETYLMFKPSGTAAAECCFVPLRKATWKWGGVASSSNNWSPITDPKSGNSDTTGAKCTDHPKWTDNTTSDHETPDP